uniref:Ig-like domain-containing protein n=1 Tax=Anopheles christyi TaxID=43041 RepID=A0A182KA22_9DIPT
MLRGLLPKVIAMAVQLVPAYQSVHITNLNVPKTYVLDRSTYDAVGSSTLRTGGSGGGGNDDVTTGLPMTFTTEEQLPASVSTVPGELNFTDAGLKPLIMDCQYEIKARECGFVLKWYFNKKLIYQWIPSRTPVGMNQFKNELQTNYSMSDSINYKYRALVIRNPKLNHSGEYMCSVQTYDSFDRRMARFQIVVPEKTLLLHYENDAESDNMLLIKCSVFMIYPEPNLLLIVSGNLFLVSSRTLVTADANHMYNKTVYGKIDKHLLISPTSIGCVLTVPDSGYIRKRETIYYDPTPLTKWSRLRMDERGHFQLLSDDGAGQLNPLAGWLISLIVFLQRAVLWRHDTDSIK